jgi:hypothetical protein
MATIAVPADLADDNSIHEAIAHRARELWEERGCVDGHAEEDWARAEAEIRKRVAMRNKAVTRRILVKAGETVYTGEYDASAHYSPGELCEGEQIRLHFSGEKMWIQLGGGRELETRIVKRESG